MATGAESKKNNNEEIKMKDTCGKLQFTVVKCSSYSSNYYPENILQDKPNDQTSRWSSESSSPPQFLILQLRRVSIVQTIKFGKFEKSHVCNVKKFKVHGGLTEDSMVELLESGLKNDTNAEVFELKHEFGGLSIPCRYLKIIPLQSWGPSFNFSIWFVELFGIDDPEVVRPCIARYTSYREREAIRVCLKHLRDHNHIEAFESLQKKTKIQLEDPLMTELYNTLVVRGDFIEAEKILERCASNNLFHEFISRQDYKISWSSLCSDFPEVTCAETPIFVRPGMRGGHQMCIDPDYQTIYIYGGWDGNNDLADFWSYHIPTAKWTLISSNTENEGGPSARSCHKMCLDPNRRQIFTLGHYVDSQSQCRPTRNMLKSDFYVYDIESNQWTLISDDTAAMGGPQLVFDHQMCIDVEKSTIYVFGGRILTGNINVIESLSVNSHVIAAMGMVLNGPNVVMNRMEDAFMAVNRHNEDNPQGPNYLAHMREMLLGGGDDLPEGRQQLPQVPGNEAPPAVAGGVPPQGGAAGGGLNNNASSPSSLNSELLYSGLYAYHIPTNTWTLLRCDIGTPKPVKPTVRSRTGHCMLFHPTLRKMFVFAGQRCKEYLNDFFSYNVDTDEVEIIPDGHISPSAGFTQRATIDHELNEVYVFSGVSKDKEKREENVLNSFWVFDMKRSSWSCIYRNDGSGDACASGLEPCPRFAHQLVYDQNTKLHYLFGGNPGKPKDQKLRLDDLWRLRLIRPSAEDLVRECKLLLRRQQFQELAASDPINALIYLQTSLYEIIDHTNVEQTNEFHRLTLLLFSNGKDDKSDDLGSDDDESMVVEDSKTDEQIFKRSQLFDTLAHYFPEHMTQPKVNLVDLLPV